jgi:signal transduction histidine kinase
MNIYYYVLAGMVGTFLLFVSMMLFYIKYRKNLLQQQYQMKEAELQHQKALLHAVIITQEQERKRIGMDLHDEVGSVLASLRLVVENFADNDVHALPVDEFNIKCKSVIDSVIGNVRNISHNLSPALKGIYGFHDAIQDFCDGINHTGKIAIDVAFTYDIAKIKLDENVSLAFYRVISELINNTLKHANASKIDIVFSLSNGLYTIEYKDNGTGITKGTKGGSSGMGMQNIESRLGMVGAKYKINNKGGFYMHITLPLE